MTKFILLAAAVLGVAALLSPAAAGNDPNAGAAESRAYLHSYNLPSSGVALEGYCPVAYFAVDKAVRGNAKYATTHNDVTYYFVSADAKKAFDANPEKFVPAFGGWCAFGMSVSDKFPVDPTQFRIINGRLMLFLNNRNVNAAELWDDGDERELLKKSKAHWAKVSG